MTLSPASRETSVSGFCDSPTCEFVFRSMVKRPAIPAQRAIHFHSHGHRPWYTITNSTKRPNGPTIRLLAIEWPPRLGLPNERDKRAWADGPGYWNCWAFGPETPSSPKLEESFKNYSKTAGEYPLRFRTDQQTPPVSSILPCFNSR